MLICHSQPASYLQSMASPRYSETERTSPCSCCPKWCSQTSSRCDLVAATVWSTGCSSTGRGRHLGLALAPPRPASLTRCSTLAAPWCPSLATLCRKASFAVLIACLMFRLAILTDEPWFSAGIYAQLLDPLEETARSQGSRARGRGTRHRHSSGRAGRASEALVRLWSC